MVNVGTGNLLLQDDDMAVPHKGIAMAFRRTYNSQSRHDVNASDAAEFIYKPAGMYGNGWTSTFDAHLARNSAMTVYTVFDIDGARYDYDAVWPAGTNGIFTPRAGNHSTLTYDGVCGYMWTKKSGTTYYFYAPGPHATCPQTGGSTEGYTGRLYQIIGRNRNTYLTLSYSWDGASSLNGKISQIAVQSESGMTATLSFADFNGHRLLQQLTYPDGATSVTYDYDAAGNLTVASRPPNNGSGTRPLQSFGYASAGTDSILSWAASPRWRQSGPSDGAYLAFYFNGNSAASSTLAAILHRGVVNPVISDGTNTQLQPGYPTSAMLYLAEYYTTGVTTPTFRDTDGHMANWVVDGMGRPTQTQECTESASQGQQCTGTWLVSNEAWDTANNLTAEIDPRGYETDYAYDANGNTIAVAAPATSTSDGRFRPTKLFDYDSFNNVVAYCDEKQTHLSNSDWTTGPTTGSDSLCAAATAASGTPHGRFNYTYPSYEPNGELASITTPLGYARHFSYAAAQQGGNDYGLPTSVTGDPFTQVDGSSVTPTQTFWYDSTGNVRCYSKGQGISVLAYDTLGRVTSAADPDDTSANAGSLCGKATGQSGWNTQTTYTYFADGAKQTVQTPSERAAGFSTAFAYDLDGNVTSETRHFGCGSTQPCTPGVTQKWYDGADRLVEVQQPKDTSDLYAYPWLTRYLYDLTQAGNVSISSASFHAHGNLFKTQEWVTGPGASSPAWNDLRGNAFDALDRTVAKYTFPPSANTTLSTTTAQYDLSTTTLGLLSSQVDPLGEVSSFTYDELGRQTAVSFTGDGGVTPPKTVTYDPNGRAAVTASAVYGSQTTRYDLDGRVIEVDESTSGSVTSPARLTYDYYPNGDRKALNVASAALTAAPLVTYARRSDGAMSKEAVQYGGSTNTFTWAYTDAGRRLNQTDPYTGTAMPSPQAPVNPGTTYAPTTWSYDSTGQLTTVGLPETLNYTVAHDAESHVAWWNVGVTGSSTFAAGESYWNTTRGENFIQALSPPPPGMEYNSRPANGALVPAVKRQGLPPSTGSSPIFDPINAVVLGSTITGGTRDADGTGMSCGPITNVDSYDAASRLISRPGNSMAPSTGDCGIEMNPGLWNWSYDAENHTLTQTGRTAQWGPTGKPYRIGGSGIDDSLHYDGDTLLFVTNAQGSLSKIALGALADIAPSGQMTVWDRDSSNMLTTGHNNTLYYGASFGTRKFGPFRSGEGPSTAPPGIVPIIFNGSTTAPACTMQSCGPSARYLYSRLEGFDWGSLTIAGARDVDNATGQWTTPDAYAGNVHDPMSQKPYAWDHNNPYDYADPSGFAYLQQPKGSGEGIIIAGVVSASSNVQQTITGASGGSALNFLSVVLALAGQRWGPWNTDRLMKSDHSDYEHNFAGVGVNNIDDYADKAASLLDTAWNADGGYRYAVGEDRLWIFEVKTGNMGVYTKEIPRGLDARGIITYLNAPGRNTVDKAAYFYRSIPLTALFFNNGKDFRGYMGGGW